MLGIGDWEVTEQKSWDLSPASDGGGGSFN